MGLQELRDSITKAFGEDLIIPGDDASITNLARFSSGSLALDIDLGGGYPEKRMIEILGHESSGKSYLAYKAAATITNLNDPHCKVAIMDEENVYTADWAMKCGMNTANVDVYRSQNAEQAIDIIDVLLASGEYRLVILDSIDALVPLKILEDSSSKASIAILAKLMSSFLRKGNKGISAADKLGKNVSLLLINQIRIKPGMMFGNPETTTGGLASKFYSSVRIDIRKSEVMKDIGEQVYGQISKYSIIKNKTAPPLRVGMLDFYNANEKAGQFDNCKVIAEMGIKYGYIIKGGSWYSGDWLPNKVQGLTSAVDFLNDMPAEEKNKMVDEIERQIGYPICFRF